FRLNQRLPLRLQEWQPEILKEQRGQLVDRDLGLVVVDPRLIARLLALAGPPAIALALLAQDVAHLRLALALASVVLAPSIEPEAGQIERSDRHLDDLLAVRGDDRLLADDLAKVA